jgi:hypothetical protein
MNYLTLVFFLLISCGLQGGNEPSHGNSTIRQDTPIGKVDSSSPLQVRNIGIGVLSIKQNAWGNQRKVSLYNNNGSIWKSFVLSTAALSDSIDFFAYSPDNFLLVLRCIDSTALFYEVVVNETVGTKKFIKRNDPTFEFQTWDQHVLLAFSVEFNDNVNPIRKHPTDTSLTVKKDEEEFYHPVLVNGNWMQIKWGYDGEWEFGWIKWRDKDTLLVELFYFA